MSFKHLFEEFESTSKDEWLSKIEKDLRGKPLDSVITQKADGTVIQPFYNTKTESVHQPFRTSGNWNIVQEILVIDSKEANKESLDHLNKGANSLLFYLTDDFDLSVLLKDILLEHIHVHFVKAGNGGEVWKQLQNVIQQQNIKPEQVKGSINVDSFENLARAGNWFESAELDLKNLKSLVHLLPTNVKGVCVNTSSFANAGANLEQQLGVALAMSYEYINHLDLKSAQSFWFGFATGSDYFGEISKLRAFRRLWSMLQKELHFEESSATIYSENAIRNKTILDVNNNMIRTTTEAMSAIIGGCDEFSVKGFDITYSDGTDFSQRIAKNQQSVLEHESHLNAVKDMSSGSYFIEQLTNELAQKAWVLFKEIEEKGGYLECLKSGWLQNEIHTHAQKEQKAFDEKKNILIGANMHRKLDENLEEILKSGLFYSENKNATTVKPLMIKRLSEDLEKL